MNRPGFGPNLELSTRARFVRASMAPIFAMALVAMCVPATAQPFIGESPSIHAVPASALIFPLFDSAPDRGTLISVTNTNSSRVSCGNTFLSGDIALHYTYFNNDADGNCYEFDRVEYLTPGDTLTIVADDHNPEMDEGWLWIETLDPETYEPITFNHIIGSAIIVEAGSEFLWSYTPYAFRALVEAPCDGFDLPCGAQTRCINDLDGEVDADFDGVEFRVDPFFGLSVPTKVTGVPDDVLDPRSTWSDGSAYDAQAAKLAGMFVANFEKFADTASAEVKAAGPTSTTG